MEDQGWRIAAIVDQPAVRQMQEHQRRVGEGSALWQLHDRQERIASFMESPGFRSLRDHLEEWQEQLSAPFVRQIESYQTDLVDRVVAAEQDIAAPTPSWSVLLWEMEGLLKTLELLTAAMAGAKSQLDFPVPGVILALLVMLFTVAELAIWLAKGPQGEEDEAD